MNMHHITKSLFVGAAIVGTGMLSGKAELKIPQSLKNEIYYVVERRLEECYRQARVAVPSQFPADSWEQKEDTSIVYNLIVSQRLGFLHFCSLEMLHKPYSFSTLKKDLGNFFREQCPPYRQKVSFSNKWIERSALYLNRRIRSVIGDGDKYGLYNDYYGKKSLVQKGIVDHNKHLYHLRHSFIFNDEFIETIARIIHNGMTIMNKMCEITQVDGVRRLDNPVVNNVVRMYLKEAQQLYCRYLVIKNSPRDINTIDACNKFIREAEKLAVYDRRIASYSDTKDNHTVDYLCSKDEKKYVNGVLCNAVAEIQKLLEAVKDIRDEGNFTDPVYWAPAPVSDKEGGDILKELEENDAKKEKDAPNAFLEEID